MNGHWKSVNSAQVKGVVGDCCFYNEWLQACDESIKALGPLNMTEAAAHMAVVMGSSDNVTVVIAQAFK